ncbi:MAG: twin-arginine translocase TatA/TatE family subunit [Bdellovibrionales bacterium]|nr:twin-arginine translocase TatA/TatE family subunit [Bdellovibrionales bacterium]
MSPGLWQIIIVVGIFALLFMAPNRLPGLGKSLAEAIRGFKKGLKDDEIDVTETARKEQIEQDKTSTTTQNQTTKEKQNS